MYRLLLVFALLIILLFLVRRIIQGFQRTNLSGRDGSVDQDQMVEDPECHTFVPRRNAVVEEVKGQPYCFCSRECAKAFQNRQAS